MATQFTEDDEGKEVIQSGNAVGRIVEVEGGSAYVDPDPSLTDTIMSKLGWNEDKATSSDTYPLHDDSVAEVTDDEVRLRDDL